jgi:hypothetical protein
LSKYNTASADFVLRELTALCDLLTDENQEETSLKIEFQRLIEKLREYYNKQGWL